jgi:hypothetical protein
MSDPITIGAGVGAGISMLRGGNPLQGAAVGGLGGAGYGALTGSGMAGNLLTEGGLLSGLGAKAGSSTIPSILTTEGAKGVAPSIFDKIGGGLSSMGQYAKENPMLTMMGATALMQPQPNYQMDSTAGAPAIIPSQQSMNTYVPSHLTTEVQKPRVDVTAPTMGATQPYRQFGFGGANMFRDPMEYMMNLNYPQY